MQEHSSSSAGQSQSRRQPRLQPGGGQTPRGNPRAGVVCSRNAEVPTHPHGVLLVPLRCCDSDAMTSWDIADPDENVPPKASQLLETVHAWPGRVPDTGKLTLPQAQALRLIQGSLLRLVSPSPDHAAPRQTRGDQL